VQQEVMLALLSKEASHGYELHARVTRALGPLADAISSGQIYVTLGRLEKVGLVVSTATDSGSEGRDRRVYELTADGRQRVADWLMERAWPRPDLADFYLKLVVAHAARLADPVDLVDRQRRELLQRLRDVQRAALEGEQDMDAALLLEGIVLRLQADLRWLEVCERHWGVRR
jgi:DNA-binding PadR family transcriptional regulator